MSDEENSNDDGQSGEADSVDTDELIEEKTFVMEKRRALRKSKRSLEKKRKSLAKLQAEVEECRVKHDVQIEKLTSLTEAFARVQARCDKDDVSKVAKYVKKISTYKQRVKDTEKIFKEMKDKEAKAKTELQRALWEAKHFKSQVPLKKLRGWIAY